MFCPLTTIGAGESVVQTTGETRLVVDCKVNPVALAGSRTQRGPMGAVPLRGIIDVAATQPPAWSPIDRGDARARFTSPSSL